MKITLGKPHLYQSLALRNQQDGTNTNLCILVGAVLQQVQLGMPAAALMTMGGSFLPVHGASCSQNSGQIVWPRETTQ